MMNFRVVTQALIDTLGDAADGRFKVIGYRRQGKSAEESRNVGTVQVFYSQGNFPKSRGGQFGDTQHGMTFAIGVTVSAAARLDLAVLNNADATAGQRIAALAALKDAANVADGLFDAIADAVYQILMAPGNFDLGLSPGVMSDRWVDAISKEDPLPGGDLVVLNGTVQYSCNTVEHVTGETVGDPVDGSISTVIDVAGDNVERTGVTTN